MDGISVFKYLEFTIENANKTRYEGIYTPIRERKIKKKPSIIFCVGGWVSAGNTFFLFLADDTPSPSPCIEGREAKKVEWYAGAKL